MSEECDLSHVKAIQDSGRTPVCRRLGWRLDTMNVRGKQAGQEMFLPGMRLSWLLGYGDH
jgi:hypothetical protein